MRITETQYRQRELDKKIKRYIEGWYDDYYTDEVGSLVVFVKDYKYQSVKNCVNIDGLVFMLTLRKQQ